MPPKSTATDFWLNPPWAGSKPKYRLGLAPIHLNQWFDRPGSTSIREHKQHILANQYTDAVAIADNGDAERALSPYLATNENAYPDPIANMAVAIDDDLCVIKTTDHQRLVAACVCSPSYWHLNEKIGHSLHTIHASVPSMNRKIGTPVTHFIDNAPLLQPFERCNWFVHGDNTRFHARPEALPQHAVRDWFIRSERETLCRLSEDYLLFTINPRFFPLTDLQQYPGAAFDLYRSIQNFDADEIDYFGGSQKCATLLAWLKQITF
jgi:hypothetical protein